MYETTLCMLSQNMKVVEGILSNVRSSTVIHHGHLSLKLEVVPEVKCTFIQYIGVAKIVSLHYSLLFYTIYLVRTRYTIEAMPIRHFLSTRKCNGTAFSRCIILDVLQNDKEKSNALIELDATKF